MKTKTIKILLIILMMMMMRMTFIVVKSAMRKKIVMMKKVLYKGDGYDYNQFHLRMKKNEHHNKC